LCAVTLRCYQQCYQVVLLRVIRRRYNTHITITHILLTLHTGGDTRLQPGVFLLSVRLAVYWQVWLQSEGRVDWRTKVIRQWDVGSDATCWSILSNRTSSCHWGAAIRKNHHQSQSFYHRDTCCPTAVKTWPKTWAIARWVSWLVSVLY